MSRGEMHYRLRIPAGRGLPDPEASRCGLAGDVTDWPAKVTCQRCRELGEADDPPIDRARWHAEAVPVPVVAPARRRRARRARRRLVSVNPDELLRRMLTLAAKRDGDPLADHLLVFHRLMMDRMPWPTAWEERRVEDVPVTGPELAADGGQRRYHQRMLTDAGPVCRRDGQPFPCHAVQVLDAMDAVDAHVRALLVDGADDLAIALGTARATAHLFDADVGRCPLCICGCGQPHCPPTVAHYAASGRLCDAHAAQLAAEARYTELLDLLKAWPPVQAAAGG